MIAHQNATKSLQASRRALQLCIVQSGHAWVTKHRTLERICNTSAVSQTHFHGPTALQDTGQACNAPRQQIQTSQQPSNTVECLLNAVQQKQELPACQLDKLVNALSTVDSQSQPYAYWGDLIDCFHTCGYIPPKEFLVQMDRAILKLCTAGVKRVYPVSQAQTTAFMTMLTTDIHRHCDAENQPPIYSFPLLLESRYLQNEHALRIPDMPQNRPSIQGMLADYWSAVTTAVQVSGKFSWPFAQTKCLIRAQASSAIISRCAPLWDNQFVLAHNVISDILTFRELDEFAEKHFIEDSMDDVSECMAQSLQLLRLKLQDLDRQQLGRPAREPAESDTAQADSVTWECRQAWNLAVHTLKLFLNWQYTHLAQGCWGPGPVEELLGVLCDASVLDPTLVLDLKTCKEMCAYDCAFLDTSRLLLYATILIAKQPTAWEPIKDLYLEAPRKLLWNLGSDHILYGLSTLELILLMQALGAIFQMTGYPQDGSGSREPHGKLYRIWRYLYNPRSLIDATQHARNSSDKRTLSYRIGLRIAEGLAITKPQEQMYLLSKVGIRKQSTTEW